MNDELLNEKMQEWTTCLCYCAFDRKKTAKYQKSESIGNSIVNSLKDCWFADFDVFDDEYGITFINEPKYY
jgi:hypothetical protein